MATPQALQGLSCAVVVTGRLLHLAAARRSMSIQWVSWNASRPAVQYGLARGALDRTAPAASRTYTRDQMCGSNAASVSATAAMVPGGEPRVSSRLTSA